ncbi:PTS sugar transporter subunit IIC [Clostridium sp. YIM B02505]|uniref:Permease IIC component n=1 Tax=Clostridium yunnanense TaxID=2800325 RepID=A0ABS1EPJ2_9CLOT|nr:PTS sugar transporter subunit IIC [Clostridium yunnanense]MBK1811272.1 PTS sugar transporter subunit IIC [Clostridium yunnanense]
MNKFFEWMEEHFVPIASKIGAQRHLRAIRDGFATIMPVIMAGAFAVLFNNLGIPGYQDFMNWLLPTGWTAWGEAIYNGSFGVMSILIVFTISYHLAKGHNKDGIAAAVVVTASSLLLYTIKDGAFSTAFFGTKGLFIAMIVALVGTEIFVKLSGNPRLIIKMPNGVPPAVAKSFAALIPSIIVLALAASVKELFILVGVNNIHESLYFTLQRPLTAIIGSLGGVLVIIFITQLLWFFGLHGGNIVAPVSNAILLPMILANTEAFQAGLKPENILSSQFLESYVYMGGAGATIALIIAIFIIGKKRAGTQQTLIANLGIGPGLFNINEPVIFGMPMVLNPIYVIPSLLAPMLSCIIAYTLTAIGFAPVAHIMVAWTTPPILGAALSTNSITGAITAIICLVVDILIYIPFVYMAGKQELKAEEIAQNV